MVNLTRAESPRLLICGASVRAAAQSAHRAGFQIIAADLFRDLDLQEIAEALRIESYPDEFAKIRKDRCGDPVMYTGALENHPALLDEFADAGLLWGNSAATVRRIRDPMLLHRTLRAHGISSPEVRLRAPLDSQHLKWLRKPLRSAGGFRVRAWTPNESADSTESADYYFQQFVPGTVRAGSFIGARGTCRLIGVSDTFVGHDWGGASDFAYCGSVTHVAGSRETQHWQDIGRVLTEQFNLVGLFGVDAIVTKDLVWPLEVNPRYTASMELFESPSGASLVDAHVKACSDVNTWDADLVTCQRIVGKCILYAPEKLQLPNAFELPSEVPGVYLADIPSARMAVEPNRPILSVLASGDSKAEVKRKLQGIRAHLLRQTVAMR
jgi:predicted ATP-grasp superfamily ATP-dependent carboligase